MNGFGARGCVGIRTSHFTILVVCSGFRCCTLSCSQSDVQCLCTHSITHPTHARWPKAQDPSAEEERTQAQQQAHTGSDVVPCFLWPDSLVLVDLFTDDGYVCLPCGPQRLDSQFEKSFCYASSTQAVRTASCQLLKDFVPWLFGWRAELD